MLSSTEMGGEQIIIHNNAHSVIWKEPGGCMFVIRLVIIMLYMFAHALHEFYTAGLIN